MPTHLSSAHVASVFPPLVVEHLNGALLLQLEDGQRELVPPLGALGRRDPVSLGVEQPANLSEVAVALKHRKIKVRYERLEEIGALFYLNYVVQHGALHEEGVVTPVDLGDAVVETSDEY